MSQSKKSSFDLNTREGNAGYDILHKCPPPFGFQKVKTCESQHSKGNGEYGVKMTQQQRTALTAKKKSKAMALATKPGQQIAMNAFMMYMSGKTLNIFSISITSMAILSPLRSIFTMGKTFAPLGGDDASILQMPKLIFVALNLVWLAVGVYKMSNMRLLPTTSADWTGSIVWKEMMETSSIPPESWVASQF
mmetsp:Transcript_6379/g.9395  ORF Transcript_6379/g.9395 Transcript_6379/m.9395 type:complete len:192 (-) Transcript_6379:79-654(-)|eukprot:CAMPEP_0194221924 /NCGR_PEP_ID=MMETSP0156-20130528/31651_1 /TAXON_ID=33649 /ORGANISM="Thalassionema nitzschioides, Strain L26-B" /LENGTH=191 /DNA_ID=CAMNT_0038952493 /DNA_START=105 /DNA_END=680 /DNA_ORIENTATION=+